MNHYHEYKSIVDDMPNRADIAIPFVVMRERINEDKLWQMEKEGLRLMNLLVLVPTLLATGIFGLMMMDYGNNNWQVFITLVVFGLIMSWATSFSGKKEIQAMKQLPRAAPFIKINHDYFYLYDKTGKELLCAPSKNINNVKIMTFRANSGIGSSLLLIDFYDKKHKHFSYNLSKNEYGSLHYFEHQDVRYAMENLDWMLYGITQQLKQNPTASHFPFKKKNYINERAWDAP